MATISGHAEKMQTTLEAGLAQYFLSLGHQQCHLNPVIGKTITLHFSGKIACTACGRIIKKAYQQGYCFPCTQRLAQCDLCIVKPERCHYHLGTCREPEWADQHCQQDHIVYLANSSGLKVGITRQTNMPHRWIDQGAIQALPVLRVASRRISGLVEIAFAKHVSDKTNWRQMLKNEVAPLDLDQWRHQLLKQEADTLVKIKQQFGDACIALLTDDNTIDIHYPVLEYPTKITSLNFDKTPVIAGRLLGIKGQYLILDNGVLNIRKFSGYDMEFISQ